MTKWITQFTLSILTKLQTNYINKFTLYPSLVSNFSQLSQPWRLCCLSLTWFLPLFTLALSLSHNFFTLNCLSRLGFSFRGKLYFSFCFMGFFWVGSNNYVLKILILLGNFLLIVILWGNNMLFVGGFRIWGLFFS